MKIKQAYCLAKSFGRGGKFTKNKKQKTKNKKQKTLNKKQKTKNNYQKTTYQEAK